MGEIIPMRRPRGSVQRETIPGQSAEILFFMGVRYVRMADSEPAVGLGSRRRTAKARRPAKANAAKRA
jgi:hypothetical protein